MGNYEKVDFSDSVVACDIKVDLCNQLNELFFKIPEVTFVVDASDSVFFNVFLK